MGRLEEKIPLDSLPKTLFCDIDGTVFKFNWPIDSRASYELLPGAKILVNDAYNRGHTVIFVTGRPKAFEAETRAQLKAHGLLFKDIIFDLPHGVRVLINDLKPHDARPTAVAVNLKRDEGMVDLAI